MKNQSATRFSRTELLGHGAFFPYSDSGLLDSEMINRQRINGPNYLDANKGSAWRSSPSEVWVKLD